MIKKVLITGGDGGIARELAALLRNEGYEVLAPGRAELDVTDWGCVSRVVGTFRPDVLVNNAGYVVPRSVREGDPGLTRRHVEVNLLGVFWCAEAALAANPGCRVVNVGSAAAVEVHGTWSEYCATKAAVVMATECWAEDGVDAVVVSPGRTRTKMRKSLFPDEDQSTLLDPADFAMVLAKAVRGEYPPGTHLIVRKQNVRELLGGNGRTGAGRELL